MKPAFNCAKTLVMIRNRMIRHVIHLDKENGEKTKLLSLFGYETWKEAKRIETTGCG